MMATSFEVQVWRLGVWSTDTWWSTAKAAEAERAFMAGNGFEVRVTEVRS